jgi:Zn-finger nucleic acid-binding protein
LPARCGGLWFDSGELAQVIKDSLGSMPEGQALGPARGPSHIHCIDCTTGLDVHALDEGKDPADVHLCTRCHGIWLERGQLERVQQSHVQQIVSKGINWKTWLFQFLLQLPVEYNLKPRRFPLITWIFFAANVLVMVAMLAGGKQHIAAFFGLCAFSGPHWRAPMVHVAFEPTCSCMAAFCISR